MDDHPSSGNEAAMKSATAVLAIEQLVKRERYLRDTEQWSRWRQCYHPDSSQTFVNISWFRGQITEFVQRSRKISGMGVSPLHTLDPVDVQVGDGRAVAVSNCQIVTRFKYGSDFDLVANLRLVSCIGQSQGRWVMQSLEGIYLQDRIQSVVPHIDASIKFDMDHIPSLRDSYKCLIWNIERKGMQARRDLPGIDDPGSVQRVLQQAQSWLENGRELPGGLLAVKG